MALVVYLWGFDVGWLSVSLCGQEHQGNMVQAAI